MIYKRAIVIWQKWHFNIYSFKYSVNQPSCAFTSECVRSYIYDTEAASGNRPDWREGIGVSSTGDWYACTEVHLFTPLFISLVRLFPSSSFIRRWKLINDSLPHGTQKAFPNFSE